MGAMSEPARSLWRHRDFMALWSGQTVSEVGSSVTVLALPLLAVISLDATTFEVGLLTACTSLAFLLVALPAGAWVDRWRRKPVLVWGDLGRVVLLGSIPVAKAFGVLGLPQLYVVASLTGVLTVFFDVAYQSYLPALVEPDQLVDANGKIGASQSFAQVAGPAVAGVLVAGLGAAYAVVVDAISFLVSAGATSTIRRPEPEPPPRAAGRRLRDEIREGLAFVVRHPILKRIVGCTATSNFFSSAYVAVEAVFLVRVLHARPGRDRPGVQPGRGGRPAGRGVRRTHRRSGRLGPGHLGEPGADRPLRPAGRLRLPGLGRGAGGHRRLRHQPGRAWSTTSARSRIARPSARPTCWAA